MRNLLFIVPLLITGCDTTPPEPTFQLTPATQTGANTLSFLADGKAWQPYGRRCFGIDGGPCIDVPLDAYYNPHRGQFQVSAFLTTNARGENFGLSCDSLFQTGLFVIPPWGLTYRQHSGGLRLSIARRPGDPSYGSFDPSQTKIQITRLDTVARVISGIFEGYLQESINSTQATRITEGRFDVKY